MWPFSVATGEADRLKDDVAYSPAKPCDVA
jgi:hypothetical protein